jgi:TatD DNase family protein
MTESKPEVAMNPLAVDTHCHLFMHARPADVVEAAREAGVGRFVCAGVDPDTSARSLELAESIEGVFATAGMHPHDASAFDHAAGARIEELLGDPLVVAVGECGLDFYRMNSPRQDQLRCLRAHIALSRDSAKPMVVHVREAWPEILDELDAGSAERVVIHCFSGDAQIARECAARGYRISFAANITYPKNEHLRQAAAAVDIDRILVETDSPFLSPQHLRGRENEPANVLAALNAIAAARAVSVEYLIEHTSRNAEEVFNFVR